MHLKLFKSRLSILLMQSSWVFKFAITCISTFILIFCWWFFLQRNICLLKKDLDLQIAQLSEQKIIFDEVILQYQALVQKMNADGLEPKNKIETVNCCKAIVDQSRLANLSLQSYVTKKLKNGQKQMVFTLNGEYQELLDFLHYLDQINLGTSCNKLHVTASGYRLQIAYVCGIHTSVK